MTMKFKKYYFNILLLLSFALSCSVEKNFSSKEEQESEEAIDANGTEDIGDDKTPSAEGIPQENPSSNTVQVTHGGKDIFVLESYKHPIDIVWAMDNSESMNEENTLMNQNFLSFINSIQSKADLKVAVISCFGSENHCLNLPESVQQKVTQVNQVVSSNDSLFRILDASGLMPDGMLIPVGNPNPLTQNSLSQFYRPNTKRIYITVSDDNAFGVVANGFIKFHQAKAGLNFSYFAFATTPQSQCPGNIGTEHIALAAKTSGAVFDICQPDWSEHFAQLSTQVISLAQSSFPLKFGAEKVKKITMDGVELSQNQYQITGNHLYLVKESIPLGAKTLEVIYQ